ncbi:hypothetical protein C2845_PM14G11720 [Panicum miliaceum]|uniref:Cellulose synthase-like protein G2 n=1 Tax=Panicum miliaceum TaxID=4540 RepID=A0A3L6PT18_PANMI|nr:hypothetical protein C2845_PM14G11720 [Panicum miliaceum]
MEASDGEPRHRSILLSYYSLPACLVLVIKGSGTKSSCCAWCCELTVDRLREDAGLSLFLQALVVPTREFGIQVTAAAAYRVASLIALLQGSEGKRLPASFNGHSKLRLIGACTDTKQRQIETWPPLSAVHVNKPLAALVIAHRAPLLLSAMVAAGLTLLFLWALSQSGLWRPVSRAAFPERLLAARRRSQLPGLDVLVVTADPDKEPALGAMNTVVPGKHSVQCPWPDRYLGGGGDDEDGGGDCGGGEAAAEERRRIKKMYETFKGDIEDACRKRSCCWTKEERQDHDAYVEKRRASPHHFKAGALNALLRVSSLVRHARYVLVLDCDMSCNTRASALEAMCFHLDRSPPAPDNLAFRNDIYTNDLRHVFGTRWIGLDGLRGPLLSGTGFYVRRDALYGATPPPATQAGDYFSSSMLEAGELATRFGHSDQLLASLRNQLQSSTPRPSSSTADSRRRPLPRDATLVASCAYEEGTGWGDQVGFMYQSVVEDYFTGYRRFFARGWTSAYCYPARPPFLGSMPTNLNDVLVQNKRWMSGMLAVGLSSHCPLACPDLLAVSVPQAMAIAYFGFLALYAFPVLCYATLPQLCFLRGVPLFPDARWFAAAFASSLLQHLVEVSVANRRLALFGCVSAFQDLLGAAALDFDLTTKASDGSLYRKGVFDFTGCSTLLLPATTLCVLNAAALVGGTWKMMTRGGARGELFPQLFLLSYVAALNHPLLEGMFLRQDPARVPWRITALSVAFAAVLLALFG